MHNKVVHVALGWLAISNTAGAEELPRWELGLGLAALSLPDYRGSDESSNRVFPIPYFVYRLDWLNADRDGLRANFLKTDALDVTLSVSGYAPIFSSGNRARQDMPDLGYMMELGPSLDVKLWRSAAGNQKLALVLPVRAAVGLEGGARYQGWTFNPRLTLNWTPANHPQWNFIVQAGPMYGSARYNQHFYGVDEQYATPTRPVYRASSGYAGSSVQVALSRQLGDFRAVAYIRLDDLHGASFEESPLVKTRNNTTVGVFFTWTFLRSAERVQTGRLAQ